MRENHITNTEHFKTLWLTEVRTKTLANMFDTSASTVVRTAKRLGLPGRDTQGKILADRKPFRTENKPQADVKISAPHTTPGLAGDLIRTKGSYAALAAIAERQGWSHARVQQEFHRARVSI